MHSFHVICALAVTLAVGCQTQPGAPSSGLGDPWPAPVNDPQITILTPDLQQWLRFHPARIDLDPGRPMQVEVPVRNLADRKYQISYRITFYDGGDVEVTPTMGWRLETIDARQTARLSAGAMSAEAVNYRLEVKWAE
jgi:uncharacterized protein YcfL